MAMQSMSVMSPSVEFGFRVRGPVNRLVRQPAQPTSARMRAHAVPSVIAARINMHVKVRRHTTVTRAATETPSDLENERAIESASIDSGLNEGGDEGSKEQGFGRLVQLTVLAAVMIGTDLSVCPPNHTTSIVAFTSFVLTPRIVRDMCSRTQSTYWAVDCVPFK